METLKAHAVRLDDFNRRLTSIIENDHLGTESKNLAIGLLVTLRAPEFRKLAAMLSAATEPRISEERS